MSGKKSRFRKHPTYFISVNLLPDKRVEDLWLQNRKGGAPVLLYNDPFYFSFDEIYGDNYKLETVKWGK